MQQSPFKFLDAYGKEDKDRFFGRDQETNEIFSRIYNNDILLVYGASGTGKTSIINCGLRNKIDETDWFPINIRRRNTPILDAIKAELQKKIDTEFRSDASIIQCLKSVYLHYYTPIFLIFDQFEEIFIFGTEEERKGFVEFLVGLQKAEVSVKIILVIREEYYAQLSEFEDDIPTIFDNRYRVEKMTQNKVEEVIRRTCMSYQIGLETDAEEKITNNIASPKTRIELTYLQVYLDKLFQIANQPEAESITFDNQVIALAGKIDDILVDFLDEQVQKFPEKGLEIDSAWRILYTFVSDEGTKESVSSEIILDKLKQQGIQNLSESDIKTYLQEFDSLKIIRYLED